MDSHCRIVGGGWILEAGTLATGGIGRSGGAPALRLRVAAGESAGDPIRSAGRSDSVVRLYALERQHLGTQRTALDRAAATLGAEFEQAAHAQRVRLRMALGAGARPVADEGQARTPARSPSGRDVLLQEFARVSEALPARAPSLAFGEGTRSVPQFELLDAFLSRLRIERQSVEIQDATTPHPLRAMRDRVQAVRQVRAALLGELQDSLGRLGAAARRLSADPAALRDAAARVSDPSVLSARVTGDAADGRARVSVLDLAQGERVESDPVADPDTALGKTGSFLLRGSKVPVQATDSLFDLAVRITYGEDANVNRLLDGAEDRNFSRTLDPREDTNGNGRLDGLEDRDGDRVLDVGEDLNLNGRLDISEDLDLDFALDGGVAAHGVRAHVERNRLVLTIDAPGATPLAFEDPDGILADLGLVRTSILREIEPENPVRAGREARVEVDGSPRPAPGNVLAAVRTGVEAVLRHGGAATIAVGRDPSGPLGAVGALVEAYNESLRSLNELVDADGVLRDAPEVARRRQDLARPPESRQDDLASSGIVVRGREMGRSQDAGRASYPELSVGEAARRLGAGLRSGLAEAAVDGVPGVALALGTLGIVSKDDGTLTLDGAALAQSLRDRPAATRSLLRDLSAGIEQAVRSAVDPAAGTLPRLRSALQEPDAGPLARRIEEALLAAQRGAVESTFVSFLG